MEVGGSYGVQKDVNIVKMHSKYHTKGKKLIKKAVLLKAHKTLITYFEVKKVKIGFWVEPGMHALFECPEDVNEITKNHTYAVSGEF